jgi:hypothetical protein
MRVDKIQTEGAKPHTPISFKSPTLNVAQTSRRDFLRSALAAAMLASTLENFVLAQNHKAQNTNSVYVDLSNADRNKYIAYTKMLQEHWLKDMSLMLKLHPEYALDFGREQQSVFAKGEPFEFAQGYIYHGRANLSDVLLGTKLPKNSYVTRVPQTWALQPFVDLETDPAIYVIDAIDFNRAQNQGKANLKMDPGGTDERGLHHYEPYPLFTEEFPISSVKQIITTKETYEKYKSLIEKHDRDPSKLSDRDKQLAQAVKPLIDNGRLVFIETSASLLNTFSIEPAIKRFLRLNSDLEKHMQKFALDQQIPLFRARTGSIADDEHSPKLLSIEEAKERAARRLDEQSFSTKNNRSNKGRNIFLLLSALLGGGYIWDTNRSKKSGKTHRR